MVDSDGKGPRTSLLENAGLIGYCWSEKVNDGAQMQYARSLIHYRCIDPQAEKDSEFRSRLDDASALHA